MSSQEGVSNRRPQDPVDDTELAFLVTHWLRNFNNSNNSVSSSNATNGEEQAAPQTTTTDDRTKPEALERIQRAASDLASAFSTLGAFGTATAPNLSTSTNTESRPTSAVSGRHATFADMNRRWAGLSSNQLGNLVSAAVSSTVAAEEVVDRCAEANLIHAADEAIHEQRRNPSSGRTVQDAIDLDKQESKELTIVHVKPSLLQRPAQVDFDFRQTGQGGDSSEQKPRSTGDAINMPLLESQIKRLQTKSSQAMRLYLDLKENYGAQTREIITLKVSMKKRQSTLQELQQKRIPASASLHPSPQAMDINEEENDANRVIAQLQRKLGDLEGSYAKVIEEMTDAKQQAYSQYNTTNQSLLSYRDPFSDASRLRSGFGARVARNNGMFRSFENRRSGLPMHLARAHALEGRGASTQLAIRTQKALTISRLSHAVTINSHINWPIYCVKFDKAGRYFITGADDRLVRLFCLGAKQTIDSKGKGRLGPGQEKTIRGAVLVCTFRGHASVINDVDVSSDNCFLATASDDGDCRVWGLKDGSPVAILRGHVGGCTMVTWSKLTPYRLVTTGEDGFARTWDIREAALKRYGGVVAKRPEYSMRLTGEEKESSSRRRNESQQNTVSESNVEPPPLPERQNQPENNPAGVPVLPDQEPPQPLPVLPDQAPLQPLPLPLPGAAIGIPGAAPEIQQPNGNDAAAQAPADGSFVANAEIDEGVQLVEKFQHGTPLEERMAAPGTRSRRAAVKVLSLARSPGGGHFATGADDGVVRVWEDVEDGDVEIVDNRTRRSVFDWMGGQQSSNEGTRRRSLRGPTPNRLLLQLKGHMNAITDLKYSNAGDRIMSGSQKDGVVRVWSWDCDPTIPDSKLQNNERGLRHIVIKLTNPMASATKDSRKSRRRGTSGTASSNQPTLELDSAVWTNDDTRIITSQSQPLKQVIAPDSNFLFVWDSHTGHCLLGIAQPHTMSCQVLLPHPTDASIFCSASKEVKVWDIETGKCFFSHTNEVENSEEAAHQQKEKIGQYLDGAFFPDGTGIVLTDYSGCISIFDTIVTSTQHHTSSLSSPPFWMKEQYFSSDYYDLNYDTNGYCIEQGSAQPPHLAPRGVRCSQARAPYPETVTDAFKKLVGPLPTPVKDCQWLRESFRSRARVIYGTLRTSSKGRRGNIMQEFDPLTTILIRSTGETIQTKNERGEFVPPSPVPIATSPIRTSANAPASISEPRRSVYSGRQLSNNYRWRDYNDMIQDERDMDEDEDDDEFVPASNNNRSSFLADDGDDYDSEDEFQLEHRQPARHAPRPRPPPTRRTVRSEPAEEVRPSRSSNRRRSTSHRYSDPDSDEGDDMELELVSTNNDPSGPHVEDYNTHFFRVPKNGPPIANQWLRRIESDSGYLGRKIYVPQVGDSVVYIPRAHFETIQAFPSLKAPWQHWPAEAEWPVVCCSVRAIRYRFPYMGTYGNRISSRYKCESIVAILTLEVTGIPVLSQERAFSWPDPHFIPPAKSHIFELDVFQSEELEEYMLPYDRYTWRLKCLEEAILGNNLQSDGVEIATYYDADDDDKNDNDLILYQGRLDDYGQLLRSHNDANLNHSGYRACNIRWQDSTQSDDSLSPWEVLVEKRSTKFFLSRKCLDDDEKRRSHEALKKVKRIPDVREQFSEPVDERRYSDYSTRVEVPCNLQFIERRLDANYYSSRASCVSDMKLIRDNCVKYNGEVGELQDSARQMYEQFERDMLSEEEREVYNYLKTTATTSNIGEAAESRSSLENLPPPESNASDDGGRRRSLRIRIDTSQVPRQASGRATRSNPVADTLEDTSFASARSRQPRRRSNDDGAPESGARPRRGGAPAASGRAPPARQSSRRQESRASLDSQSALEVPDRRSTRRTSQQNAENGATGRRLLSEDEAPDDHSSGSESDAKPPARPTRRSSHAAQPMESPESGSESDSEHKSNGASARAQRASLRHGEDSPPQSRKREARRDPSSDSDEDESNSDGDDDSEEMEDVPSEASDSEGASAKRRSARAPARKPPASSSRASHPRTSQAESPSRHSGRRSSTGNQVSYADLSESEFEEPLSEDENSEDEESTRGSPQGRGSRSRRAAVSSSAKGAAKSRKRRKADSEEDLDDEEEEYTMTKRRKPARSPRPKPWFELDTKRITKVTLDILSFLRTMDVDKIFEAPVVELFPDIEKDYRKLVPEPMDYRTIEEERLPCYRSIRELQQDLILVFQNCIAFNGASADYSKLALEMLDLMDDAFENAADS